MTSKKSKHKKSRSKASKHDKLLDNPEKLLGKLQKYSRRGKHRRLDDVLSDCGKHAAALTEVQDAQGRTLLHQACLAGHHDAAKVLLRHGANPEAQDHQGNTPAHLAADNGHLVTLQTLLQCKRPPDIHIRNLKGVSIEQLVLNALHSDSQAGSRPVQQAGAGSASSSHPSESESEEAAWRRRLAEEASDHEGVYESDGGAGHTSRGGWAEDEGPEGDDAWADRMWAEMQAKRRAAARTAARSFASSFKEVRAAQEAQEAAARAATMDRLKAAQETLRQEQERDARWRSHAAGAGARAALPGPGPQLEVPALDPVTARASYEKRWLAFEQVVSDMLSRMSTQQGAGSSKGTPQLTFSMVAWPLPEGYSYDVDTLRELVLSGVQGPTDIKKRLRAELVRWHPDKFESRVTKVLAPQDRERVLARVKELSQVLTAMMSA